MNKQQRTKKLKALGLPDTLFDADFNEKFEQAKVQYEAMSKLSAELLATDEWKDVEFPWSADLDEWNASGATYEPGVELVQSETPMWTGYFKDWCKNYKNEFLPVRKIKHRLKMSWNNPPAPGTKMHRILVEKGIDPQQLMQQLKAERDAERGA